MKISLITTILIWSLCVACQKETETIPKVTDQTVQNIETFARLYGYARWFHPSDEAQEIDWSKFAVLGIQKVENVNSAEELQDALFRLFSPIVQGLQIYKTNQYEIFNQDFLLSPDPNAKPVTWQHYGVYLNENSNLYRSLRINKNMSAGKLFDRILQFGEIINEPIGNNLTCVVPLVLLTNDEATYPKTEISSLNRLKSEINSINYGNVFNLHVNLASVVIAWNVLQHFFRIST